MKAIYFVLCIVSCSTADAAFLSYTRNGNATSWFLNGQSENGTFNGIKFKATISPPTTFTNPSSGLLAGVPRPPGQAFTYRNRLLDADPLDYPGGLGLFMLGAANTPTELSFFAGSFSSITTANESESKLFLANVNASDLSRFNCLFDLTVQLYSNDILIAELQDRLLCPEPSAFAITGTGLAGVSLLCRRKRPLPAAA